MSARLNPQATPTTEAGWSDLARRVATRATTPLWPDDYLGLVNPLWTARELRGRVVAVRSETHDAATLVIRPGWGWRPDFQPGQYVGIGLNLDGRWYWRSYSISSSPDDGGQRGHRNRSGRRRLLSITVKAMPEGFVSEHLVRGVEPGTVVRLALPQGNFVLPEPPPPKVLFWTAGSGITPVMSMLRTLERRRRMPDVVHVHSAPCERASIFRPELGRLAARHEAFCLVEHFGETDGRLHAESIEHACPDWRERQAWVCGPESMLEDAERHWAGAGLADQLHVERFSTELTATATGGHVVFAVSGKESDIDGATTLLEAGEAAGIKMPFGCRMGICHTCVLTLRSGVVKDLRDGTERQGGQRVQTCIAAAAGDCVLDI